MELHLNQLQYAVSEKEFEEFYDKKISAKDLPVSKCVASLTKKIDIGSAPTPHIGEYVSDSYWPSDYSEHKVTSVNYLYSENICYVDLEPFVMIKDSQLHKEMKRISKLHDWECIEIR